ncbi:hypothetical protein JRQ81_010614, partial [Phrynocephalus forsythii]
VFLKILSQKDIKNLKEKGYYKIKDMHELMSTGGGINKLKGIIGNQKWMVAESMKRRYEQWFHSLKGKEDRQWEVVYKKYEEKKVGAGEIYRYLVRLGNQNEDLIKYNWEGDMDLNAEKIQDILRGIRE